MRQAMGAAVDAFFPNSAHGGPSGAKKTEASRICADLVHHAGVPFGGPAGPDYGMRAEEITTGWHFGLAHSGVA